MPFRCPSCDQPSLQITQSLELPANDQWDEITVQALKCSSTACGFAGIAIYEESRRGTLNSECVVHTGYAVRAAEASQGVSLVADLIRRKDDAGLARIFDRPFAMRFCQ